MTDIENIKLPEPIKVKPSIAKYLDKLEDQGKTIFSFTGASFVETLSYLHLLNKYHSKCYARANNVLIRNIRGRSIGVTISLKVNYSKEDELMFKEQFSEIAKGLADCVKRGENTIIIPLGYVRASTGHSNILILRMNTKELEHYEPHGGEFLGNEKLQQSAKRVLSYFVNILNKEFKKDSIPEVKYVEASQVCPYISGLQKLETESKLKKNNKLEPGGYCTAWSIFFAELCLKNPDITSSELLDNVYNYLTTKPSASDYLKSVIRGYAGFIAQTIDVYLAVFFKRKITLAEILSNYHKYALILDNVFDMLVSLEVYISMTPDFNLKKELKKAMKEYRNLTKGKTKAEQIEMRKDFRHKNVANAYYKKRILQNFEEYKRIGRVTSEPIFDSPEEINEKDIKQLDILEKGLLHKQLDEIKKKQQEEFEKTPGYAEYMKRKEEIKKERARTRKIMKEMYSKTKKNRS